MEDLNTPVEQLLMKLKKKVKNKVLKNSKKQLNLIKSRKKEALKKSKKQ